MGANCSKDEGDERSHLLANGVNGDSSFRVVVTNDRPKSISLSARNTPQAAGTMQLPRPPIAAIAVVPLPKIPALKHLWAITRNLHNQNQLRSYEAYVGGLYKFMTDNLGNNMQDQVTFFGRNITVSELKRCGFIFASEINNSPVRNAKGPDDAIRRFFFPAKFLFLVENYYRVLDQLTLDTLLFIWLREENKKSMTVLYDEIKQFQLDTVCTKGYLDIIIALPLLLKVYVYFQKKYGAQQRDENKSVAQANFEAWLAVCLMLNPWTNYELRGFGDIEAYYAFLKQCLCSFVTDVLFDDIFPSERKIKERFRAVISNLSSSEFTGKLYQKKSSTINSSLEELAALLMEKMPLLIDYWQTISFDSLTNELQQQ